LQIENLALAHAGERRVGSRRAGAAQVRESAMGVTAEAWSERRPYNAATDFVDANVAAGRGEKVAFIDPQRKLTYAGLQERSCAFACGLQLLGLRQEARILLLMLDTMDYPVAFWGAIRAGVVPIPLNTLLTPAQYAYIFNDSRAEAVIVSAPLLKAIEPIIQASDTIRTLIVAGASETAPTSLEHGRFEELLETPADVWHANTCSDDIAFWLYSSGSTGEPKGTRHVHTSLIATAKLYGQDVLGIRENDIVYSAAKLFFAYGLGNAMSFPMSVGATAVLIPDRPTPEKVLQVLKEHQPTIFYGVPTLYAGLLAQPTLAKGAGSDRLRACVSAGEALPANVGERWREIVGVDILDGIGSTEMLHIFVSNVPGGVHYGTSGRPVPGYDARIVDDQGRDVAQGEIGELVVRGPSSADGYWNQRAKSRRTFAGEWTYTGDKYMQDGEGNYVYCGRTDDMFKVSGIWVSPFEVEAALVSHPAVLEAAVIGREDDEGLVKPKAFIVLRDQKAGGEKLFDELKAHVQERAGMWKYPRWIEVREELPKTATGKIQRFKLRNEDAGADA
jgi:4-hydroxybenzoate-CoA ligase